MTKTTRYRIEHRPEGSTAWNYVTSRATRRAADELRAHLAEHPRFTREHGGFLRTVDHSTGEPVSPSQPVMPLTGWPTR